MIHIVIIPYAQKWTQEDSLGMYTPFLLIYTRIKNFHYLNRSLLSVNNKTCFYILVRTTYTTFDTYWHVHVLRRIRVIIFCIFHEIVDAVTEYFKSKIRVVVYSRNRQNIVADFMCCGVSTLFSAKYMNSATHYSMIRKKSFCFKLSPTYHINEFKYFICLCTTAAILELLHVRHFLNNNLRFTLIRILYEWYDTYNW